MSTLRQKHQRRARARGFTLTELMVSLVMGLIVALAAVGLARTATTTFHEQARSSQTEMSVRVAVERLKLDLMRTSYMMTGNIALDPKVSQLNSAIGNPSAIARYNPELTTLRGISIDPGMATVGGVPGPIAVNLLTPDAIDLVGNFTTDDSYSGIITMGTGAVTGTCANPQVITLDPQSDAAVNALGGGTPTANATDAVLIANATAAFLPVAGQKMLAQVVDAIGCANYVPVCGIGMNGHLLQILVDGGGNKRGVLYSNSLDGEYENPTGLAHNCGSSENGRVSIAPLQHVRWYLKASSAALATDPALGEDQKYDLVRQVLDFTGAPLGGAEIIAEYAVDLKFGILYDDPSPTAVGLARQVVLDLDSDNGGGDIFKTTAGPDSQTTLKPGPQRVRAVKFRIAIRTAIADRDNDLPSGAGQFRARYCAATGAGLAACVKWSRVRTVVSEVGLTNQARMTY